MTAIATTGIALADSWQVTVGEGWITLMLIGMGLCFVFMLGSMWSMRDGRGWGMCGHRSPQQSTQSGIRTGSSPPSSDAHLPTDGEARP